MTTQLSEMFCNQCEQAAKGTGCEKVGTCGKSPDVAALQDLLVHACRSLSNTAVYALDAGLDLSEESEFVEGALFTTLTNVDFDPETVAAKIDRAMELRDSLMDRLTAAGIAILSSVSIAGCGGRHECRREDRPCRYARQSVGHLARCRRAVAAGDHALRYEGRRRLRAPRTRARPDRPRDRRVPVPHARRTVGRLDRPGCLGGHRARVRQGQPAHDGDPRRGQHRHLRPSGAHQGPAGPACRQGDPRLRPRPGRPRRAARADRRQGRRRLHARRDASGARVSRAQEVRPPRGPLRHRVAEPAKGVRRVPRRDPDDHQLPDDPARRVQEPRLHRRPRAVPRRSARRQERLLGGHREGAGRDGLRVGHQRRRGHGGLRPQHDPVGRARPSSRQ